MLCDPGGQHIISTSIAGVECTVPRVAAGVVLVHREEAAVLFLPRVPAPKLRGHDAHVVLGRPARAREVPRQRDSDWSIEPSVWACGTSIPPLLKQGSPPSDTSASAGLDAVELSTRSNAAPIPAAARKERTTMASPVPRGVISCHELEQSLSSTGTGGACFWRQGARASAERPVMCRGFETASRSAEAMRW